MKQEEEANWLAIIARALATLAMHKSELANSELTTKAGFLEGLGLPRTDAAKMLGTTSESLRVMTARKKRGGKRAKSKTSRG